MKKLVTGFVLAAFSILGIAGTAGAYPPAAPSMTLSPSTVAPGGTFTATFSGCALGEVVTFTVAGGDTDTATCSGPAGSSRVVTPGAATASVTLTAPTAPGTYAVTGTGGTSGATATATLTVTAPAAGGDLPTTGSNSAPTTQIAVGVLLAGLGLTGVALYRRRSHVPA